MTTFFIQQFGCRATQADGAALERQLLDRGCIQSPDPASAAIVVLNTCTVTAAADAQARDAIRKLHAQNPASPPNRHRLLRPTRPRRTSLVTRRHPRSRQFPQTPNPQPNNANRPGCTYSHNGRAICRENCYSERSEESAFSSSLVGCPVRLCTAGACLALRAPTRQDS